MAYKLVALINPGIARDLPVGTVIWEESKNDPELIAMMRCRQPRTFVDENGSIICNLDNTCRYWLINPPTTEQRKAVKWE